MSKAFLFPGQGSQAVGMGREMADAFPEARLVFEEVDEALKQKLSHIIFEGPDDQLTLTENAQPAIMATSMAVLRVLEKQGNLTLAKVAAYVAGHSLGEYTALCAAGTFTLADTARLLKIRGQAMQKAVPVGQGAMAALLGLDYDAAAKIALEAAAGEVCVAANDNAPGQVVISGGLAAVDRALAIAAAQGVRKAVKLPVSAPFHCPLMQPAADAMAKALAEVAMNAPSVPLVANVLAEAVTDPARIRALLVEQVTGMVRWRESVMYLKAQGVDSTVELGAGKVLSGLVKRIEGDVATVSLQSPQDIEAFLKAL
ncbi:MAG: ACP S-malonyltransferase [Alphaproteobacteria bacterium]|nr:ACP S-malonyltransferase [Alphaproteobacteria bacterium]